MNKIKGRETLNLIDRIAQGALYRISYRIGEFSKFPKLSVEKGLEESEKFYQKMIDAQEWCESYYWVIRKEGAIYRAIYAAFLHISAYGEDTELEPIPVERVKDGVPIEAIPLLVEWSDKIFKKVGHEMNDFYNDFKD